MSNFKFFKFSKNQQFGELFKNVFATFKKIDNLGIFFKNVLRAVSAILGDADNV